jgi:hypothetical protein
MAILADENRHARNMAPPHFFNVYFAAAKILSPEDFHSVGHV